MLHYCVDLLSIKENSTICYPLYVSTSNTGETIGAENHSFANNILTDFAPQLYTWFELNLKNEKAETALKLLIKFIYVT